MDQITKERNKQEFIELLRSTKREGIEDLINWLSEKSDFFEAPSSTIYHCNYPGGLCQHSLNVYYAARDFYETYKKLSLPEKNVESIPMESIIITALLHDLCKANFYGTEMRNKKNEAGVWEKVPFYTVQDQFPYGHGEKSVYILNRFVRVSDDINLAIRFHMGFSEPKEIWNSPGKAMDMCPLVLALHEADMESTHLLEEEN